MADYAALSARIEAASGPSRELDAEIHEALGGCAHRETEYYCIEDGNDSDSGFTCKRCGKDMYGASRDVKPYTSDLNAAYDLTKRLAPGCPISMGSFDNRSWASVRISGLRIEASARPDQHLALAICAAAVKAATRGEEK